MNDDFHSLTGIERARHEDWSVAIGLFTWATHEYRKMIVRFALSPNNKKLEFAADDIAAARLEKLSEWEPTHRKN